MTLRQLITAWLQNHILGGCTKLAVDDEARALLRGWMLAERGEKRGGTAARGRAESPPPAPAAQGEAQAGAPGTPVAPGAPGTFGAPGAPGSAATPPPPAAGGAVPPDGAIAAQAPDDELTPAGLRRLAMQDPESPPEVEEEDIPFFRPGGSSAEETWELTERLLPVWKPLQQLGTLRRKPVFGIGNRRADIVFVGDAPGYVDEQKGEPFGGEAGEKLDGILRAMGLSRSDVYITYLVKFRPAMPRQTINTRPPSTREILYSLSVVDLELRLVQPKVIVALGVIAARGLLQRGKLPLAEYREQPGSYRGIPVIVTHHPSYLLRTADLGERRHLWEDMLRVMQMAQLPISDKQRGYFLPARRG